MTISKDELREKYKNYSVEELEKEYKSLDKFYYYETKDDQIKESIRHFFMRSFIFNLDAKRVVLEDLLRAKTGKNYMVKIKTHTTNVYDIVDYISRNYNYTFEKEKMYLFIKYLNKKRMKDGDARAFIITLLSDEKIFGSFVEELKIAQKFKELFKKYLAIAKEIYARNRVIG